MKKTFTLVFLFLLSLLFFNYVSAQPPTIPVNPNTNCFPPSACIPIDGGIGFLVLLAAAFGLKKLYSSPKKDKTKE